jgi:hypothetical protein
MLRRMIQIGFGIHTKSRHTKKLSVYLTMATFIVDHSRGSKIPEEN